ncbi:helix-turn-helix transcriptional regulator [Streptomyces sp. 35G-GA-8]|uniref:ArsR/SmtB family transcription factor n=1 Tax=Streptomyces sp. 35G-GA-8 TaxID=2939434 RepID=UPI00201ED981|nr:winged helix-turn-helix domain-containing protein [Streptomyces sp. 35G-GA-8]MCL7382555.1 winged helix-turn-helix domain-containing protein [Streptomyces sp. 35G-GA-8]
MAATLGPLAESALALYLYGHNGDAFFHKWRHSVRAALGGEAHRIATLSQKFRTVSEVPLHFPEAFAPGAPTTGSEPFGNNREQSRVLLDLCEISVLPQWDDIRRQLDGARDNWGRVAIAHGVDRLLGSMHPKVRWHSPVLELRDHPTQDVHLRGSGLLLVPSYFLSGQTCLFLEARQPQAMHAIAFPVTSSRGDTGNGEDRNVEALGALVGHTRAAALAELAEGCFTSELADRLGISLAGASKHTAILRRSGLITTARNRNTALHALTPLGAALLRSSGFLPENPATRGTRPSHPPSGGRRLSRIPCDPTTHEHTPGSAETVGCSMAVTRSTEH